MATIIVMISGTAAKRDKSPTRISAPPTNSVVDASRAWDAELGEVAGDVVEVMELAPSALDEDDSERQPGQERWQPVEPLGGFLHPIP
jgi:hypothetical protein